MPEPRPALQPIPDPIAERDLILSRICDGAAAAEDWQAFRRLTEAEPAVWGELADLRAQHEALSRAVEAAGSLAEAVDVPISGPGVDVFHARMRTVRVWGGWAAAAVLLVGLTIGREPAKAPRPETGLPAETASLVPAPAGVAGATADAEEAFRRYLSAGQAEGTVVAEVPDRVLLETRPLADGSGVEFLYLRQVLERRTVPRDEVFQMAEDETGEIRPVQAGALPAYGRPL